MQPRRTKKAALEGEIWHQGYAWEDCEEFWIKKTRPLGIALLLRLYAWVSFFPLWRIQFIAVSWNWAQYSFPMKKNRCSTAAPLLALELRKAGEINAPVLLNPHLLRRWCSPAPPLCPGQLSSSRTWSRFTTRMSHWLSARGFSLALFQLGNSPVLGVHFDCNFIFLFYPLLSFWIDGDIHKIPENNYPPTHAGSGWHCSGITYSCREKKIRHTALLFFNCILRGFFFSQNVFRPSSLKDSTKFLTHLENTFEFSHVVVIF